MHAARRVVSLQLGDLCLGKLGQLECILVLGSDVIAVCQALKIELQVQHLFVIWIVIVRYDWNAVVQLEGERVDGVVDKDNVAQVSLIEDAQVFDVEVGVPGAHAARSVEARLKVLVFRINVVDYRISILLLAGGENDDLKVLVCSFQTLDNVRPNVDAGHHGLWIVLELYWNDDIWVIRLCIINAVDQCLVEIKHDRLCLSRVVEVRQVDNLM